MLFFSFYHHAISRVEKLKHTAAGRASRKRKSNRNSTVERASGTFHPPSNTRLLHTRPHIRFNYYFMHFNLLNFILWSAVSLPLRLPVSLFARVGMKVFACFYPFLYTFLPCSVQVGAGECFVFTSTFSTIHIDDFFCVCFFFAKILKHKIEIDGVMGGMSLAFIVYLLHLF